MKTTKFISTVCLFVLCIGFMFAEKPTNKDKKTDLTTTMIASINADVVLTDSQKVVLSEYAKVYISKMEAAHSKTDNKEKMKSKETAFMEYESMVDSILTPNQREIRMDKIKQREAAASK